MVQFLCPFSCCGILVEYLVSFLWGGSEKASKQCREKRGLSVAIESDLSATEKDAKKDKIRKNAITKRKKASNQAENDHSQRFQENTSTISKNPISTNQATIKQIHGLIIPHFYICNLLRSLYQLTKYNTICFLSHLKAFRHRRWYQSIAMFLSKWSGTQAGPPFNMNWFCCQIALESVMGAAKGSMIVQALSQKYHYQS